MEIVLHGTLMEYVTERMNVSRSFSSLAGFLIGECSLLCQDGSLSELEWVPWFMTKTGLTWWFPTALTSQQLCGPFGSNSRCSQNWLVPSYYSSGSPYGDRVHYHDFYECSLPPGFCFSFFFCCLVAFALMTSFFVNSFLPLPKIPQEKECDTKVQLITVGQSTYHRAFSSTSLIYW